LDEGTETTKDTKVSPRNCKRYDATNATVRYESVLDVAANAGTTNAEFAAWGCSAAWRSSGEGRV
jgi:hypothetical protein